MTPAAVLLVLSEVRHPIAKYFSLASFFNPDFGSSIR
jgi:hypothetical protein